MQKTGRGRDAIHVAGDRLDDHSGDVRADLRKGLLNLTEIVVGQGHGLRRQRRRHAGRGGHAQRQRPGAGLDQQRIGMAVVATLELDDLVAAGAATRQPNGAHGRLGAGIAHPHQFHGWDEFLNPPRHDCFDGGGGAEAQAVGGGVLHRAHHRRMGVAGDHRSPGTDVVNITMFILVIEPGARAAFEEDWRSTDAAKGTHRRIDAAGNMLLGFGEQVFGTGHDQIPQANRLA